MTDIAKYNTYKGISTALSFGTPLVTMACIGDMFVSQPSTAISGAAVFAILLSALLTKDKLAEKFKAPSALIVAIVVLLFCVIVENILLPLKIISLTTIAACGVDELTFKGLYKRIELRLPPVAQSYKRFGFYGVRQRTLDGAGGSV